MAFIVKQEMKRRSCRRQWYRFQHGFILLIFVHNSSRCWSRLGNIVSFTHYSNVCGVSWGERGAFSHRCEMGLHLFCVMWSLTVQYGSRQPISQHFKFLSKWPPTFDTNDPSSHYDHWYSIFKCHWGRARRQRTLNIQPPWPMGQGLLHPQSHGAPVFDVNQHGSYGSICASCIASNPQDLAAFAIPRGVAIVDNDRSITMQPCG